MDINAWFLNSPKFRTMYTDYCHKCSNLVHVTFTLNPILNKADILTQYRSAILEFKNCNIFYYKTHAQDKGFTVHPGFKRLLLVPELTKTMNIHFHGILHIDKEYNGHFLNELKRLTWDNKTLGRQMFYNPVSDTFKDRATVAKYAFKDIEELKKFPDWTKINNYKFERNNIDF